MGKVKLESKDRVKKLYDILKMVIDMEEKDKDFSYKQISEGYRLSQIYPKDHIKYKDISNSLGIMIGIAKLAIEEVGELETI